MKELVKKAMHGDTQAFVTVIQECTESMYRVARSFLRDDEDIADVLQTTIMVCFEKIDTLRNPNYFKTWMIRILINECKDMLMRQKNIQLTESLEDILDRDRQFCQSQIEEDFVKTYQVSEETQKLLFDKGVVDMPGKSIEHNGVTMTMEQCVSDQQFFYCLFRLDLPETVFIDKTGKISGTLHGKELDGYLNFSEFEVMGYKEEDDVEPFGYNMIYDSDYNIMGGEYYVYIVVSGMHTTKKLEKIYDVDAYEKKYGDQAYYWYEDTLDYANAYIYNFKSCVTKEDYAKGHMTFHFKDLEFVRTDTQGSEVISGVWDFTWAEKNVKMTKTYQLNQKMSKGYYKKGKSRLTEVRIGPLSMCTLWNYDKNEAIMPPDITAIEYKNGEIKMYGENSSPIKSIYSMDRWYDEESGKYQRLDYIEFNQVVNPEDVVAVYYGAERIELN